MNWFRRHRFGLSVVGLFVAALLFAAGMIEVDSLCAQNVRHQRGFVCDVARGFVAIMAPSVRR